MDDWPWPWVISRNFHLRLWLLRMNYPFVIAQHRISESMIDKPATIVNSLYIYLYISKNTPFIFYFYFFFFLHRWNKKIQHHVHSIRAWNSIRWLYECSSQLIRMMLAQWTMDSGVCEKNSACKQWYIYCWTFMNTKWLAKLNRA